MSEIKQTDIVSRDGKLSFKEKLGYALTAMGSDMTTQFTGSFLQLFFTSVVGIPIKYASLVISLSAIWDAINDPLIASWVDNHKFKKGERMRPILLYSLFPFVLFFVLIFTTLPTSSPTWAKMLYSFGMYFIYMIPRTFYYLPVFTLRQVASPDVNERLKLNAYVSYGQAFGSALPTLAIWPLMLLIGGKTSDSQLENGRIGYFFGALIIAIIVIICSLFNYFTTKERVVSETKKTSIFESIKLVFKNKNFIYNLILFFCYGMCVTLTTGYATYYCIYVMGNSTLVTYVSAMFIVGTLVMTPFVKKMYNKLGRNKTMLIGSIILVVGAALFTGLAKFSVVPAFIYTFLIGVGTAITIIVISVNRADVTDVLEWKENRRMDGMVSNVTSLVKKLASALITLLIGFILDWCGFIESTEEVKYPTQPESAQWGIVLVMGIGVLISAIVMCIFSTKVTLDKEIDEYKRIEKSNNETQEIKK